MAEPKWKKPVVKYSSLVLLILATVLLLIINLSGVEATGFTTTLWFSQYSDPLSVDGFYYKRWTLYRLCGATYSKTIHACSQKTAAYPLNPANVILSYSYVTSTARHQKYIDMSKAAFALLLLLLIVTIAALLAKVAVLKFTKYVLVSNILHMVSVVFCATAFSVTTAVHVDAVNFYTGGKLGNNAFGIMWGSFASLLVSLILGVI